MTRARETVIAAALGLVMMACGGGGSGEEDESIDASTAAAGGDAAAGEADASAGDSDGGDGLQFCGGDAGTDCGTDKECCDDGVCRTDCGGGSGTIQCDCSDDCPTGGDVCCETADDTFCTPKKSCEDFGGTEIDVCT